MGGGILQLVAIGVDNLCLTGDPEITLFKIVYRRHTNFSLQPNILRSTGSNEPDGTCIIKLDRKGDLLNNMCITIDLPTINLKFLPPTVGEISNILAGYNINWNSSNPSTSIVTLSIYNNDIVPTINNFILDNLMLYDYNNLQYSRYDYFNKSSISTYLDYIGMTFLLQQNNKLIQLPFFDIGAKYLIYHLFNNPNLDYTNVTTYTDIADYSATLNNKLIISSVNDFLISLVQIFATYAQNISINLSSIEYITSYVNTFFTSQNEITAMSLTINSIISTTQNDIIVNICNHTLTSIINSYIETNKLGSYITSYLKAISISFIGQIGSQIDARIADINANLILTFFGLYSEEPIFEIRNIFQLFYAFGFVNDYYLDCSYLIKNISECLHTNTQIRPIDFILDIKFDFERSPVEFYLESVNYKFCEYANNNILISLTYITNNFLLFYSTTIGASVNSYLSQYSSQHDITNNALLSLLNSYLSTILARYNVYLNGSSPTSLYAADFMTFNTLYIHELILKTFTSKITNISVYIFYEIVRARTFGIDYLNTYIATYTDTTTYSISKLQTYVQIYSLCQFLNKLIDLFLIFMINNNITTPNTNTITNFYANMINQIAVIENYQAAYVFSNANIKIILELINNHVSSTNIQRISLNTLNQIAETYLNDYVQDNTYTISQYINSIFNAYQSDLISKSYYIGYLQTIFNIFSNYTGSVDSFFINNIESINSYAIQYYSNQRNSINTINSNYIDTLVNSDDLYNNSLTYLSITTNQNTIIEIMKSFIVTDSNLDNLIDPTDNNIPTTINSLLFSSNSLTNRASFVLFMGLYSLFKDCANQNIFPISDMKITNGNTMRIKMYNYYLDHIAKNYIITPTFVSTGDIINYTYPDTGYNDILLGSGTTILDPNYYAIKDNVIFYHALSTSLDNITRNVAGMSIEYFFDSVISNMYNIYIDDDLLGIVDYKTTGAYKTFKKYIAESNSNITNITSSSQIISLTNTILNNIQWNNELNIDMYKVIINALFNNSYGSTTNNPETHYKIFSMTNSVYENVNNSFNIATISAKNIFADLINQTISGIPNDVINYFQKDIVNGIDLLQKQGLSITENPTYIPYLRDFSLWKNLCITPGTTLYERLSSANTTLNGLDYTQYFSSDYSQISLLNYIPYLVVRDIPLLINQVLQNTYIDFLQSNPSIYTQFLNNFNLSDADENSGTFTGNIADLTLKYNMYTRIAYNTMLINTNNVTSVVDDDITHIFKQQYILNSNQYGLIFYVRHEGLFPQQTTVNENTQVTVDSGNVEYLPIDWICNSYMLRYETKITLFINNNFSNISTTVRQSYINFLLQIIGNTIQCFTSPILSQYSQYVSNGYSLYGINDVPRIITNTIPTVCDAISSIWNNIYKLFIQKFNNFCNDILLSEKYYSTKLGHLMLQVFRQTQTQFVNVPKPFTISNSQKNFDELCIYALHTSGSTITKIPYAALTTNILGIPSNATNQYEIMIYQFLSEIFSLYLSQFSILLDSTPSLSNPDQIMYMITQFMTTKRDIITNLEIQITSQNISLFNFGRGFLNKLYSSLPIDFETTFSIYTNTVTTNSSYGFYLHAYLINLYNLFIANMSSKLSDQSLQTGDIISLFYVQYSSDILYLENNMYGTILNNNTVGFAMNSIVSLMTSYVYYSNANPHQYIKTGNSLYSPVSGFGYDIYKIRSSPTLQTILTNLTTFSIDLVSYYDNSFSQYQQKKSILNIYNDAGSIRTNSGIKSQTYSYDTANNVITYLSQHTKNMYVIPKYTNNNSTIVNTLYSIINDTSNRLHNKHIGVYDVIQSGNDPNTINGVIFSSKIYINICITQALNQTDNPLDISYFPTLYSWYNYLLIFTSADILNEMSLIFTSILSTIAPEILFGDKNGKLLYNNFDSYKDVLFYLIYRLLLTTSVSNYINIDQLISQNQIIFLNRIKDVTNENVEIYLKKLNRITTIHNTSTPQSGFKYLFLSPSDINMYSESSGLPNLNTLLETTILNLISNTKPEFAYVKELGHKIIESVSLYIDGQCIETHTSNLLHFLHEIYDDIEHKRGYDTMIGNTPDMYTINNQQKPIKKLYIPMRFWFCRHDGCAMPLISMLHTEALLKIKLGKLSDILYVTPGAFFAQKPKFKCSAMATYVYIDDEERTKMISSKLEYLFERYIGNIIINITKTKLNLDVENLNTIQLKDTIIDIPVTTINDPTKFLIWFVSFKNPLTGLPTDIINWQTFGYNIRDSLGNIKKISPIFDKIKIRFNGRDREIFKDEIYFSSVSPWARYMPSLSEGEYVYCFGFYPLLLQPSGTANLSQIEDLSISFKLVPTIAQQILSGTIVMNMEIWGCTYNIFRFISGMAAPLFYF